MNTFLRSSDFDAWLSDLADQKAKARILARILSATFGNFGIANPWARAFPRCVFMWERGIGSITRERERPSIVLLAGGVKASQTKDINRAKKMVGELKRAKG